MRLKTALSIAGSDSSGGAGIQADLKTMTCNGVFAMSAITALTAQNTTGVTGIYEVSPDFLGQQIDAVFTDIYPDAVKIGMVSSAPLIHVIAQRLADYDAPNIVVDPVMVATSGAKLLADDAIETLCTELLPLATVATPNLAEAEILSGQTIETEADIAELETYEERQMFLEEAGLSESGVSRLIRSAYKLLDLETYFTTGPDETRAWTYRKGTKAPQAAGIIHTDFERGFIRAEVIKYGDYVALGSEKACREAGKIAVEGKEYIVQDGDIMHFLFNV